MSAPVLFLDVDGVLNCEATFRAPRHGRHRICRERVTLLNEVVAATGCRITMSSAWRIGSPDVRGILKRYGLKARFSRAWRTPWFDAGHPLYGPRGHEIANWLTRNPTPSYAIVDDDGDMLPEQMPRFVQTTFKDGLDRASANALIALLRRARPATQSDERMAANGLR